MKLAFYKASKGNFIDYLIGFWTRPNFFNPFKLGYSHVEILFNDNVCFSCSPRENKTRWKTIHNIETSGHWDIIEIFCFFDKEDIKVFCNRELNKKYDFLCIFLTFLIPFDIEEPRRWICSELAGKIIFNLKRASRYSPNKLFKYININNLIKKGK